MTRLAGALISTIILTQTGLLFSKTIVVPVDFPTITAAVAASSDGDVIEVEDGTYLEENIALEKNITLKSRKLYGAVIYAAEKKSNPIFIVRARVKIQGFILKNGYYGIEQRESQDVAWEGSDLIFLGMHQSAVSINDIADKMGSAYLRNILIDQCTYGITTNDAHGIDLSDCLIANCKCAFNGFDHNFFKVDRAVLWNCREVCYEDESSPGVNSKISLGKNVFVLNPGRSGGVIRKNSAALMTTLPFEREGSFAGKIRRFEFGGAFAFNILGDIYDASGDHPKALSFYRDALVVGERTNSNLLIWEAYYRMARTYAKMGNLERALGSYKRAVGVIEAAGSDLPQRIYRSGFSEDRMRVYEELVSFLYERHKEDPPRRFDREAFLFAEKSKSQGFLDRLEKFRTDLEIGPTARLDVKNIADKISKTQRLLQARDISRNELGRLTHELELLESSYRSLMAEIRCSDSEASVPIYSAASSTEEIQHKLIADDTALLEYMVGDKGSFAFLVTREDFCMAPIPEAKQLGSLVQNYLEFLCLNPRRGIGFKGGKGGKRLLDILVNSFGIKLQKKISKLIIVPDHVLYYLPFETLVLDDLAPSSTVSPSRPQRPRYLVEDYEIAYAPSASSLMNLLSRRTDKPRGMDLLAVACSERQLLWSIPAGIKNSFPPLGYASREIQTIADFFPLAKRRLFLNKDAQEANIKKLPLADFKIIHLATHGFYDDLNWWRSALFLGRNRDSAEDGLLQPLDISQLNLNSDLVVLSACQAGKGELQKGEGILGFSMAFLAAGSAAVISSLWSVDDASTALFMECLYGHLVGGMTKASALRLSKMEIIKSGRHHPFYWGSFILVGDANSALSEVTSH